MDQAECTCREPSQKNDICEMFVERFSTELNRKVLVRTHYYRTSCPVHGEDGIEGFRVKILSEDIADEA